MHRIELIGQAHTIHRRWTRGAPGDDQYAAIQLGRLDDGHWFAAREGRGWNGAWAGPHERDACEAVERWLRQRPGLWSMISD